MLNFANFLHLCKISLHSRDSIQWTAIQWTISQIRASTEKAIEWTFFHFLFIFQQIIEST